MNLILRLLFLTAASASLALRAQTPAPVPPSPTPEGEKLVQAAGIGDINQVKALLAAGVPIDSTDKDGCSALFLAAEKRPEVALYLIEHGANVNLITSEKCTAILNACYGNDTPVALALLDHGADPNVPSRFQQVALMQAANHGNDELVQALIDHHADVNANCNQGTALYWAVGSDHASTVKLLIDAGARFDLPATGGYGGVRPEVYPILGRAASTQDSHLIDQLLEAGADIHQTGADGSTALIAAVSYSNLDAEKKFIDLGAPIDAQNQAGKSALFLAVMYANLPALHILLEHGANLDLPGADDRTPLMEACACGRQDVVQLLVDAGADINLSDKYDDSALTYAASEGRLDLVHYLEDKGARDEYAHPLHSRQDPQKPLPSAKSWALALGAIYSAKWCQDPGVLGGGQAADEANDTLRQYQIHNRDGLLQELDAMASSGQHDTYFSEGQSLAALSDEDFLERLQEKPSEAARLTALRKSYLKWGNRTGLAWDLCRAAMLVNAAYSARWYNEQQAWEHLLPLAQEAQSKFGSWQELSDNFLDGRQIWNDGVRDPEFEACAQLLVDPNQPLSPYNENPWQTSLAAGN